MKTQTKQILKYGLIGIAILLPVLFFANNFFKFQSSLLTGVDTTKIVSGTFGIYEGILSTDKTKITVSTGVLLSSDGLPYGYKAISGNTADHIGISVKSVDQTISPITKSISGVITYDKSQLSLPSTASLLKSNKNLKFDPLITKIIKDSSGAESGEFTFEISGSGAVLKPTMDLFKIEFTIKNPGTNLLNATSGFSLARILAHNSITPVSTTNWLVESGSLMTESQEMTPISISTDGSKRIIEEIVIGGERIVIERFYDKDDHLIKEIRSVYDIPTDELKQRTITEFEPLTAIVTKTDDTTFWRPIETTKLDDYIEYRPNGKKAKEIITDCDISGNCTVTTIIYDEFGNKTITICLPDGTCTTTHESVPSEGELIIYSLDRLTKGTIGTGAIFADDTATILTSSGSIFKTDTTEVAVTDLYQLKLIDYKGGDRTNFIKPISVEMTFEPTKYSKTLPDMDFINLQVLQYQGGIYSVVPGVVFTENQATFNTQDVLSYIIIAKYKKKPAPTPTVATIVSGGGGSGGTGETVDLEKLTILPTTESDTLLASTYTLDFSKSEGKVNLPVRHSDPTTNCEVSYEKGTVVTWNKASFSGRLKPIARFSSKNLFEPMKSSLPKEFTVLSDSFISYANLFNGFSKDVTLKCNLGKSVDTFTTNIQDVQIVAYDLASGTWLKIGDISNFDDKKFTYTVKIKGGTIIGVVTSSFIHEVADKFASNPICEDPKIVKKTPFNDANVHWSVKFVCNLYFMGAISGYKAGPYTGTFQPDRSVTRAELLKILMAAKKIKIPDNVKASTFPDINGQWFTPYVNYAKEMNIVDGYADGTFRPYNTVNRAEALKMILNVTQLATQKDIDEEKVRMASSALPLSGFRDVNNTSWFSPYVSIAKKFELISGKKEGLYFAGDEMTRGEISKVVFNAISK